MSDAKIPSAVIAEVSDILSSHYYSHSKLNTLFQRCGAPDGIPTGNCVDKCAEWLRATNSNETLDAISVLGCILQEFMDFEKGEEDPVWKAKKERVKRTLEKHGLSYQKGGTILGALTGTPTRSLQIIIRGKDLIGLGTDFERALVSVRSDPPAAITAACAILESLFKTYIQDKSLVLPNDQSVKPLWKIVQDHLGLQPSSVIDQDMNRILGGLSSIVDGVGALRTHAGSAHGRGRDPYPITGKHARLAVHSAHTLATFILEIWGETRTS
jgi:hypothetical protein